MRPFIITIAFLLGQSAHGQNTSLTFTNHGKPIVIAKNSFYSSRIHEVTLNPDSTFEFWSRPFISCFTWHHYKGTWKKEKDTLYFSDRYEIEEDDSRATYKKDSRQSFFIIFRTDKNAELKHKTIKVQFVYDFNANLEDSEKMFILNPDNTLNIPFQSIPNLNKLAAIRIEYQLNNKEIRHGYLTENKTLNLKQGDIPNIIHVEFVENPKKEMVYRTTKGIIKNNTLVIVSTSKTRTTLPDYYKDIEFEDGYVLYK